VWGARPGVAAARLGGVRMGKVAWAAAFAACFSLPGGALAADLSLKDTPEYYAPSPIWTGLYFGGHVGGVFGDTEVEDTFDYNGDPFARNNIDSTGVISGVQLGYNVQRGNVVFGVEADLGYLSLSGDKTADLPHPEREKYDPNDEISAKYSIEGGLYGDLTARLGYAADKALFYVKGGAAFVNAEFNSHYVGANCSTTGKHCGPANPSKFDFETSDTLWGWTIGVGVEYALSKNWSLKAEYQHFDFGSMSLDYEGEYTFNTKKKLTSDLEGSADIALTVDAVKVGVNYKFGGDYETMK
jgi:outer membrane immunogenic protein